MVVSALITEGRDPAPADEFRRLIDGRSVVVSFVTRDGDAVRRAEGELGRTPSTWLERTLSRFVAVQPDDELMTARAALRDRSEREGLALGQKIHDADRWIAATALHLGVELVSDDAVFENVAGLSVLSLNG